MTKSLSFIFAILLIAPLQKTCLSFDMLGSSSAVTGLFQFVKEVMDKVFKEPETMDQTLLAVCNMNDDIQYQIQEISKSLKDLPSIIDLMHNRNKLQDHIVNIGFIFKNLVEMKKNIEENRREHKSLYVQFKMSFEPQIDKDIYEIQRMLLDDSTASYLTKNFTTSLQLFENVCQTGMSHLQLLDSLLSKLKVSTAQYFMAKNMMYDLLQSYEAEPNIFDATRENLRIKVRREYNTAVRKFKTIMATASQELWNCDTRVYRNDVRYKNKPDSPYYELLAFSKYIFNEAVYSTRGSLCLDKKCRDIKKVDKCELKDIHDLCHETRKCPNNLIGCDMLQGHRELSYVCINDNRLAFNRYTSFVPKDKVGELSCPDGKKQALRSVSFGSPYTSTVYCDFCQCICPENLYYISTLPAYADAAEHKVVTGAKLVIQDNTIYIKIQQAAMLANGMVNTSTLEWKPIDNPNNQRVPITWEGIRSIDLTISKLPKKQAVVGLGFVESKTASKRISLVTYSCGYAFKFGQTLCPWSSYYRSLVAPSPQNELKLIDADVSTKSIKPNVPYSTNNQYVRFTITSMQKDAGQTTIPFIDTQEVVTNPPMALSGTGLILRGQSGYGGFLALKLYTYNIVDHIEEEVDLKQS